jgi:hypothetical protein
MSGDILVYLATGDGEVQEITHEACTLRCRQGRYEVLQQDNRSVVAYYREQAVVAVRLKD